MGFFSWKTADSDESIPNIYVDHPNTGRTVYLLQPGGKPPIAEEAYEGYGRFGDVDAFEWLAENNLPKENVDRLKSSGDSDDLRLAGIMLDSASAYYQDTLTGKRYSIFHDARGVDPEITHLDITYNMVIESDPDLAGLVPNDLIASGRLVAKSFEVNTPLKFSFDEHAVYENLQASSTCPDQGYFYADEDEDESSFPRPE